MSYYDTVLTSAKSVVSALANFNGSVTCDVRKRPFVSTDHGDTLPFCVFAPTKERVAALYMPNGVHVDYPVLVAIFQARGGLLDKESERQWQSARREEVRQALHKSSLAGASTVIGCVGYDPDPVFDLQGLDALFDVSLQLFTFRSNETRSV